MRSRQQPTTTNSVSELVASSDRIRADREQRLARLWRMTAEERVTAMWRGELNLAECLAWSARHPDEVPQIRGEFAYLRMGTPEWHDEI